MIKYLVGLIALSATTCFSAPVTPAEADLMAPVHRFQLAFNRGDASMPTDVFTDDASVLDGFSPYIWVGRGTIRAWYTTLVGGNAADHQSFLAHRYRLSLQKPATVRVDGGNAYIVVPAIDRWDDGARHYERAYWLITERRFPKGWRISSHAWAIVASQ